MSEEKIAVLIGVASYSSAKPQWFFYLYCLRCEAKNGLTTNYDHWSVYPEQLKGYSQKCRECLKELSDPTAKIIFIPVTGYARLDVNITRYQHILEPDREIVTEVPFRATP